MIHLEILIFPSVLFHLIASISCPSASETSLTP
jgi:hypothetical protein